MADGAAHLSELLLLSPAVDRLLSAVVCLLWSPRRLEKKKKVRSYYKFGCEESAACDGVSQGLRPRDSDRPLKSSAERRERAINSSLSLIIQPFHYRHAAWRSPSRGPRL
jgi:hypothetical protein